MGLDVTDQRTAADRQEAADARAWAAAQGIAVAATGRLPKGLLAAFQAQRDGAASGAGDDGAELLDGGELDGGELADGGELEDGELEDGGQDQAGGAAVSAPQGSAVPPPAAPPPADLEEARKRLGGGGRVRPPWAARPGKEKQRKPPAPPIKVTRSVSDDITGKLTMLLTVPVSAWQTVDPACGGAAADNLENIVRTAVPLICLSQDAVRFFSSATKFMLVWAFLAAVQPVAATVYQHHVTRTIAVLQDGRIVHGALQPDGTVEWPPDVHAAAPPPRPDYSAYTTQVHGHVPPVPAAG